MSLDNQAGIEVKSKEELENDAFEMLTSSADQGFVWAQTELAKIYSYKDSSLGKKHHDMEKALHYYCLAARQGSEESKQRLADHYRKHTRLKHNTRLITDHTFCSKWLLESANANVKESLYQVGIDHLSGNEFCEKNIDKALLRLHAAARLGNKEAEYMIAWLFRKGEVVEQDLNCVNKWSLRSHMGKNYLHYFKDGSFGEVGVIKSLPKQMLRISLENYWGFSPKVLTELADKGINTIEDMSEYPPAWLIQLFVSIDSTQLPALAEFFEILDLNPINDLIEPCEESLPPSNTRPMNNMCQKTMDLIAELEASGGLFSRLKSKEESPDDEPPDTATK